MVNPYSRHVQSSDEHLEQDLAERPNDNQQISSAPSKSRRTFFIITLAICCLGAIGWYWSELTTILKPQPKPTEIGQKVFSVQPRAIKTEITIQGIIEPNPIMPIIAPFDGLISLVNGQIGSPVNVGDVILTMDTGSLETELRNAEAEVIKARRGLKTLINWTTSSNVITARRSLEAAEINLKNLQVQVSELTDLYKKGIVSRNEYEGTIGQRDRQKLIILDQRLDLEKILAQAAPDIVYLAELTLQNAKLRHAKPLNQIKRATVRADQAGILIRTSTPRSTSTSTFSFKPGVRVASGQLLLSIADASTFIVSGTIDEIDVHKIKPGQTAVVQSDAFPEHAFSAEIINVSTEAVDSNDGGQIPAFEITARFSLPDHIPQGVVRLGMSARMMVETYSNPQALMIPTTFVKFIAERPFVMLKDPLSGTTKITRVELGPTTLDSVEIRSGLRSGDQILLQNQ